MTQITKFAFNKIGEYEVEMYQIEIIDYKCAKINVRLNKYGESIYSAEYDIQINEILLSGATGIRYSREDSLILTKEIIVKHLKNFLN